MMSWWENLEDRDRRIMLIGGVALAIILVYLIVWEPLDRKVSDLKRTVDAKQTTLQWMSNASRDVAGLKSNAQPAGQGLGGRSLLSVVDQSARRAGLGSALKRVEPEDKDKVRVWLEMVPFDSLVTWTGGLSKTMGVQVDSIRIERQAEQGRVNARVTLEEPAR